MANHGNDSLGAVVLPDVKEKKTWQTPRMEKLDVTVHTQNNLGSVSDGPNFS